MTLAACICRRCGAGRDRARVTRSTPSGVASCPSSRPRRRAKLLGEWNGHLVRLSFVVGRELLVSDIVYLEPPP